MEKKRVIAIGIVFFVTIFLSIWGFGFLKGKSIFSKQQIYYAMYEDVGGLNVGSPVTFKGFKIGIVDKIKLADTIGSKIVVTMLIDKDFKIPMKSNAQIYNADLIGTKGLRINSSNLTEYHKTGDTIMSTIKAGMIDEITKNIMPLKDKTESLIKTLDTAIQVLNDVIIKNKDNLNSTFSNINKIAYDFEQVSSSLSKMMNEPNGKLQIIISDLQSVSTTLKDNQPQLQNAINNFSNISDSLAASNIKSTLLKTNDVINNMNQIIKKLNNGEGTLGQLLVNDSLYINIEALTNNLNNLIEDIQENPRKYLRVSVIDMSKNSKE